MWATILTKIIALRFYLGGEPTQTTKPAKIEPTVRMLASYTK